MKDCKGHDCTTVDGEHSVACRYEYALARLGLTDTPEMRVLFWDANDALLWDEKTDRYITPDPVGQHDSDCSTNNHGVPELLGPCDCSLSQAKPTCTDERPCVNCFSGQGGCLADQGVLSKIVSAELVKAQSGDLVIFRVDAGTVTADDVEPLSKYLHAKLPAGVICMVVVGDVEITSMSEEQLKQVGLVRVGGKESDDLTQFLEQTDFDAAEKVASDTVANQRELPAGKDDCEGCKI